MKIGKIGGAGKVKKKRKYLEKGLKEKGKKEHEKG